MSVQAEKILQMALDEAKSGEIFFDRSGRLHFASKTITPAVKAELWRVKGELEDWYRAGMRECVRCFRCPNPGACRTKSSGGVCAYE